MKVNREELLHSLELVQPGLSTREVVEQSSHFIFQNKRITTYNDEVSCRIKTILDFEGAIKAAPLLNLLRRMKEETIDIEVGKKELLIKGVRKRSGLTLEKEITAPMDAMEAPSKWHTLHEEFLEGVKLVEQCASKNEAHFNLTCVRIHPKWVEASDNFQISRYRLKTGVEEPLLVRRDSIKHVVSLGMTEFSVTDTWIHFRNPTGLVMACRKYIEEYPDLSQFFKVEGEKMILPKGLKEATENAEIFSGENADDNSVLVELRKGKMRIGSQGTSGWYQEYANLRYKGKPLSFMVSPLLLVELTQRYNECYVSEDRLKVNGGKFVYIACTGKPEKK